MRYLRSRNHKNGEQSAISALAMPFVSTSGAAKGSLYMLFPRMTQEQLAELEKEKIKEEIKQEISGVVEPESMIDYYVNNRKFSVDYKEMTILRTIEEVIL